MERFTSTDDQNKNSLREVLDQKQLELEATLLHINEEVELWNLLLEQKNSEKRRNTQHELAEMAQQAIESLDAKWPFFGDDLHVTGTWYVPDLSFSHSQINFPMSKQDAFNIAKSNGFNVFETEEGNPRVGASFLVNELPIYSAAIQGKLSILTYADLQDISLLYVKPTDVNVLKADIPEVTGDLMFYDQLLMLHYQDNNSEFFRKSAKHQQKFLHSVCDKINEKLPSPQNGIKPICSQIEVPYVYRRIHERSGSSWEKMVAEDSENILMAGNIEGIGILDNTEFSIDVPIRSKQQLVDPDAGICLIIQVEQCSIPDVFNNQPVYVPIRLAEQIEIYT